MAGKRVKLILLTAFIGILLSVTYLVFVLIFANKFPTFGGTPNPYLSFDTPQSTMSNNKEGFLRVFFDYRTLKVSSNNFLKTNKLVASTGVVTALDSQGFKLNKDEDFYLIHKSIPVYLIDSAYVDQRLIEKVKVVDASYIKLGTRLIYNLGAHPDYPISILVYPKEEAK